MSHVVRRAPASRTPTTGPAAAATARGAALVAAVILTAGIALGAVPGQGRAATTARPQLSADQAAAYGRTAVLRRTGAAGSVDDPWDPRTDPVVTAASPPSAMVRYRVDAGAADGVRTFATVQGAVNRAHLDAVAGAYAGRTVITVAPGTYHEVVYVPAGPEQITLWGLGGAPEATTIDANLDQGTPANAADSPYVTLVGPAHSGDAGPDVAAMYQQCAGRATIGTFCSAVLWSRQAGFQLKNLTVRNSYDESRGAAAPHSPTGQHQAVALQVEGGDRTVLEQVHLIGNQDTALFRAGSPTSTARTYVDQSVIEGDVDFLFGWSTVFVECSEIRWTGADRGLTKGFVTAPDTNLRVPYGFVLSNVDLTAAAAGSSGRPRGQAPASATTAQVALARQWFSGAKCSPYGSVKDQCAIDTTDTTDSSTSVRLSTLETVGKTVVLNSRLGPHLTQQTWADWNTDPASPAYRTVTFDSDGYWNALSAAGKNPATLYPAGRPSPPLTFLAEYANTVTG